MPHNSSAAALDHGSQISRPPAQRRMRSTPLLTYSYIHPNTAQYLHAVRE